jgi:hypothetical protein
MGVPLAQPNAFWNSGTFRNGPLTRKRRHADGDRPGRREAVRGRVAQPFRRRDGCLRPAELARVTRPDGVRFRTRRVRFCARAAWVEAGPREQAS